MIWVQFGEPLFDYVISYSILYGILPMAEYQTAKQS